MSNSVVVTTEEELRVACEKKVEHILIKGDLAKTVEKNMKQRKTRKKFMIGHTPFLATEHRGLPY